MAATTMPSTSSLSKQIRRDYPQFAFKRADVAHWSPDDQTVYHTALRSSEAQITLLHELGHAIKGHLTYHQDIELLRCEREAWHVARTIAPRYGMQVSDDIVESALDSYRLWLHSRSRCPRCENGGSQTSSTLAYECLLCGLTWSANDARQVSLRRTVLE